MRESRDSSWLSFRVSAMLGLGLVAVALPALGAWWVIDTVEDASIANIRDGQLATAKVIADEISTETNLAIERVRRQASAPELLVAIESGDADAVEGILADGMRSPIVGVTLRADGAVLASVGRPVDAASTGVTPRTTDEDALVDVVVPVGDDGEYRAVLSFTAMVPSARSLRFGETGSVTIVDREANVILTGEPRRVGRRLQAPQNVALIDGWEPGTSRYFGPNVGREELAAFVPVDGFPSGVFVTQATDEALAATIRLSDSLFVGALVLVATGLAIALVVAQVLSRYERTLRERVDELEFANRELERLNAALDAYGGRVAHDLRAPLATARMATTVLDGEVDGLGERSREAIDMIRRATDRGLDLADGLLRLARASGTPTVQPVDIEEVVRDVAHAPGVEVSYGGSVTTVVADPIGVRQIVENLVGNALKYASGAEVTVGCTEEPDGWLLEVADRGPGLPDELAETAFDAFRQGDGDRSSGAGLGLAIVATTASAHGGHAWYEPRPGGGAIFKVRLPKRTAVTTGD